MNRRQSVSSLTMEVFGVALNSSRSEIHDTPCDQLSLLAISRYSDMLGHYSTRRQQAADMIAPLAHAVAANGFARDTGQQIFQASGSAVNLSCIVCGAEVTVDIRSLGQMTNCSDDFYDSLFEARHRSDCEYSRLYDLYIGQEEAQSFIYSSPVIQRLVEHLSQEKATSKAEVAVEFGFENDAICTMIGVRYLTAGQPYPDAGSLIEDLSEPVTSQNDGECPPLIPGLSEYIGESQPPNTRVHQERPATHDQVVISVSESNCFSDYSNQFADCCQVCGGNGKNSIRYEIMSLVFCSLVLLTCLPIVLLYPKDYCE